MPTTSSPSTRPRPTTVVLIYAVLAGAWILFSDRVLEWTLQTPSEIALAGTLKGYCFVACTSLLLYGLLSRSWPDAEHETTPPPDRLDGRSRLMLGLPILLLTLGAALYTVHQREGAEGSRLQSIAQVKVEQIKNWLDERTVDVKIMFGNPALGRAYRRWRQGDRSSRDDLVSHLLRFGQQGMFQGAWLVDDQGQVCWHSPELASELDPGQRPRVLEAIQRGSLTRLKPFRDSQDRLRIDFVIPLEPDPAQESGHLAAWVVLRGLPSQYISPTFFAWPGAVGSGELVMFHRSGNQWVFHGRLRSQPTQSPPLRLGHPDARLLAYQLEQGASGQLMWGVDYAGAAVLEVGYPVPETDWFLLAKMDRAEVYMLAASDLSWIALAGLLGLLAAGALLRLTRQRQQLAIAQATRQAQEERLRATHLLASIADNSADAIFAKGSSRSLPALQPGRSAHRRQDRSGGAGPGRSGCVSGQCRAIVGQ